MQVLVDRGACSGVDPSPARFVSARGSERVRYTSSLLGIWQCDMQVLRIWTITSLERRKWLARRNRYLQEPSARCMRIKAWTGRNSRTVF